MVKIRWSIFFVILVGFSQNSALGQTEEGTNTFIEVGSWNFSLGVGADLPIGDLADRFGTNLAFKGSAERLMGNGWFFGIQYDFMFGNTVKEDVLGRKRFFFRPIRW